MGKPTNALLLDEPLGALDKNLREQMQIELRRIHRELRVTTIYVTHDQTEAMTMSDRIAVFNAGCIEQVDTPLVIYQKPQTRFVAGFVGDNNVLSGTAAAPSRGEYIADGLGKITGMPLDVANNAPVWLAVRPESMRLADSSTPNMNRFPFKISATLNFGDSILLHGSANGHPLKVRLPVADAGGIHEGKEILIHWPAKSTHAAAVT